MATTDFRYASESDLQQYFNRAGDFDSKRQLVGEIITAGNLHTFYDTGDVQQLFVNGSEETVVSDTPDSNNEWQYYSATNKLLYYNSNYSSTTILEQSFEGGSDSATFIKDFLENASLELHNYLDRRYSTPLPKNRQIYTGSSITLDTRTSEYDPIIIKCTCYVAAANMIRAKEGASEEADYFMSLVTNPERTGIIDKLNDGIYKLSYEYTNTDKSGRIRFASVNTTMELVEISGEYTGEKYDVLKVNVSTSGAFGVAKFTVGHYGDGRLFGVTTSPEFITGGLQHLYGGIYGRWDGLSASTSDMYEIVVYSKGQKQTNASSGAIEMVR